MKARRSAGPLQKYAAGLLVHPALGTQTNDTGQEFFTTVFNYGTKVAGLQILPPAWVPPYVALPAWLSIDWADKPDAWVASARRRRVSIEAAWNLASGSGEHKVIVRSSAVGEGLNDRGLYRSICVDANASIQTAVAAIEEIYTHFVSHQRHAAMGICLQRYMQPDFAGHVSNETHLSASRNQWKYGLEIPVFAPDRGLNSKFASSLDVVDPITLHSQRDIPRALRRVCNWANLRVDGRSHLEWCGAGGRLWIVQLDQEGPTSTGANPHIMPGVRVPPQNVEPPQDGLFNLYRTRDDSVWRKLRNVRDFWTEGEPPKHRLFFARGDEIAKALARKGGEARVAAEIDLLTAGRAVLRTDTVNTAIKPMNLPRTFTVDGTAAANWLRDTLAAMRKKGATDDQVAIILHRYIPARAAAWTFYAPGDDFVQIDALWGLPDGLQFLSHDTFQVDARTGIELAAQVRFKPDFLQEQENGEWRYVQVARQFGRDRVLSREALRALALQTVAIAKNIKDRAQIMWFCDLPDELGLGQHLPWYRSKEFAGVSSAERPALPERRAQSLADLDALEQVGGRFIIRVAPEVQLVREDDKFLDHVISLAQAHNLPVELAGSVLGHAYYRLRGAGIMVIVPQPKYPRARGRQRHFKVVRDAIPQNIAAKGERVSVARLPPDEAFVALIGKLFEEGLELNAAVREEHRLEELADVLEVIRGLATNAGIAWETLVDAAIVKRSKRGGFEQQTVLLETERPKPNTVGTLQMSEAGSDPPIQLRDLGVLAIEGSAAAISFSRLLANSSMTVELSLGSRTVQLSMALAGEGLQVQIAEGHGGDEVPDSQLELFPRN